MSDGMRVWFEGGPFDGLIGTVAAAPLAYRHSSRDDDQWWSVLYLRSDRQHSDFPVVLSMSEPELVP